MTTQSKVHQALAKKVTDDYLWGKRYRDQFSPDWERYYRLYRNQMTTQGTGEPYPFASQVFVPYVHSIIETQLPIILGQLFGGGRFIEAHGRRQESELQASAVGDIVNYQLERNIDTYTNAYMTTKESLILGTSAGFVDYEYETRKVRARVPKMSAGGALLGEKTITMDKVVKNQPVSEPIDIFRYFQCPITPGNPWRNDNVLFAGWEFSLTKEEMFQKSRDGIFNNNVSQLRGHSGTDRAYRNVELRLGVLGKSGPTDAQREPLSRSLFPCIMYFGKIPTNDNLLEYRQVVVCYPNGFPEEEGGTGDGIIVRDVPDPFFHDKIPINLVRVNLNQGELYGMGDIEVIESLQIELTDQRNQRNDNIVRLMDPMWKKKRNAMIDDADLFFRPNGVIEVDEMDDIQPLLTNPQQLQHAFTEESVLKQDMQFATGITDFIVGTFQNSTGFNDTATGISLIQAAAQNRVILKSTFIQQYIKHTAEMIWAVDAQYLPFDTVFNILNPGEASKFRYVRVTPAIIKGEYDFTLVPSTAAGNPQVRQQQLVQIMQSLPPLLQIAQESGQPVQVNWATLIKRMLDEFDIPNVAQILPQTADFEEINGVPEQFDTEFGGPATLDPNTENAMIADGERDLPTNPGDDDTLHIIEHQRFENEVEGDALAEIQAHILRHAEQTRVKKEELQSTIQQLPQLAAQEGVDAGPETSNPNSTVDTGSSSPNDAGGVESLIREISNATAGNS